MQDTDTISQSVGLTFNSCMHHQYYAGLSVCQMSSSQSNTITK